MCMCSMTFEDAIMMLREKNYSFFSLTLNPLERCVPVLVPKAKKSEKIEITYFWPEMTYVK